MTLTTPERTYGVLPRVAIAQQATHQLTNQRLLRLMVANLVTAGALVNFSCNGVIVGTWNDGVNRWTTDADVVFADAPSAHSWMVLDLPAGLGGIHLLIEAVALDATAGDVNAYLSVSGWINGSTTAIPDLVDGGEVVVDLLAYSGLSLIHGALPHVANYAGHLSVIYATGATAADHDSLRVIVTDDADEQVVSLLLIEKHYDGPAAFPYPYGGVWQGNTGAAQSWQTWTVDAATVSDGGIAGIGGAPYSSLISDLGIPENDGDGTMVLAPVGAYGVTAGWLGYIPDLFLSSLYGTNRDKTIPSGGTRLWACLGNIVVPWNGTTALGGGSVDARVMLLAAAGAAEGDTDPPTIANITPAPDTELASRDTPIVFDVLDAAPGLRLVLLTLRYATIPGTLVVHDGTDFLYPFDGGGSTRDAITNGYRYTVLPRGGWAADIEDLHVYAVDQAGNLEDP